MGTSWVAGVGCRVSVVGYRVVGCGGYGTVLHCSGTVWPLFWPLFCTLSSPAPALPGLWNTSVYALTPRRVVRVTWTDPAPPTPGTPPPCRSQCCPAPRVHAAAAVSLEVPWGSVWPAGQVTCTEHVTWPCILAWLYPLIDTL